MSMQSGNTAVVLLASSTANDQLFQFGVVLQSLSLTSQSGKTVNLLAAQAGDEFMHLNGNLEPLTTVNVPQGVYTSATAMVFSALPACAGQNGGQLLMDEALGGIQSTSDITIDVPQPITVAGSAMGLVLNLQVSRSAPFSGGCSSSLTNNVQVAPVFNLTPVTIAAQPTNISNGMLLGLDGSIGSVSSDGSGLTVNSLLSDNVVDTPSWQLNLSSGTVFQGVSGPSKLAPGMPVDLDAAIQQDGTLLVSRLAVLDTNTANLALSSGPPQSVYAAQGFVDALEVQQQGDLPGLLNRYGYVKAEFGVSPRFRNLGSLPFAAGFSAADMVDGQNIFITSHFTPVNGTSPIPTPATRMTLMPQTIDGAITDISSEGGFTTYTVRLASYDLFPNLAVQGAQPTRLKNPNTVVVYADTDTQMLNSGPVDVGGVFRFNGLVFNDNGTLRMDCAEINDGVAQ
jgi:hypothetical protein